MVLKGPLQRHDVTLKLQGEVQCTIMAATKDEAIRKLKDVVLAEDGQTPKSELLPIFSWDVDKGTATSYWRDACENDL